MHKRKIRFVLGIVVFVGLLGLWIFLKTGEKKTSAQETSARTMQTSASDSEENDADGDPIGENFQSICVEYGDGRKTLEIQMNGEESCITDLEENRTENSVREKVVKELENLSVVRDLGEQTELAQYGLKATVKNPNSPDNETTADGEICVVLTQENGTSLKFQIGSAVPDSFFFSAGTFRREDSILQKDTGFYSAQNGFGRICSG